jgi:endonuclease III
VTPLSKLIRALDGHYGPIRSLAPRDPFQLLLWEYVAYLADDPLRAAAFAELKKAVGLRPDEVAGAPLPVLGSIARSGGSIAPALRAKRMHDVAVTVRDKWRGSLRGVLRLPYAEARRALKAFPSIGPPGADKILLLTGAQPILALDSNALRVLLRLGYGREDKNYAKSYASAQTAAMAELPKTIPSLQSAFLLLQHHGRELCRRTHPSCTVCPLRSWCPFGGTGRDLPPTNGDENRQAPPRGRVVRRRRL